MRANSNRRYFPRRHWPHATLRSYLVAIVLTAAVPLAALVCYQLANHLRQQRTALMANLQGVARALSVGVDRELVACIDGLVLLGQSETLQRGDIAAFKSQLVLRGLPRRSWDRLVLLAPDGSAAAQVDGPDAAVDNPLQPTEAEALMRRWHGDAPGRPVTLSLAAGAPSSPVTWVGQPVVTAAGSRYLLAARIGVSVWQAWLEGASPAADGGSVILFDAQHRIIAGTLEPARYGGSLLPAAAAAAMGSGATGMQRTALPGGGDSFIAWQLLAHGGWGVGVGVAAGPIDASQRRAVVAGLLTASLCLLLGVTAALLVARRVAQPLRQLAKGGAAECRQPIPVREIAQLRNACARSDRERAAATALLARKAEAFEAVFRHSPAGLALAQDSSDEHVLTNAALDELMPLAADQVGSLRILHHGAVLPRADQPLAQAARTGRRVEALELEVQRPGMAPRIVRVSAVPLGSDADLPRGAMLTAIDVTGEKLAERERMGAIVREHQARREAESANRAKDDLLAMLGHELRNPLNGIVTAVEVLNRVDRTDPLASSARAVVGRQTRRLASMVDQLQDLAQVMTDAVVLNRKPLELGAQLQTAVSVARLAAAEREHQLVLAPLQTAWVNGDAHRLSQVLEHLLDNAMKYNPTGGRITISLVTRGEYAVFSVADSGQGIAPELLARMFEPFAQGERSLDRAAGGLGLGLTLVKRLVELHGGSVRPSSGDGGSRFEVWLRLVPLEAVPEPWPSAKGHSVGLIDDNDDALTGMRSMLELAGHSVRTAADGNAGLAMLLTDSPEVAIVDIGLPGIDGYEVARRSRAGGYRGRLIALSGYGQPRDLQRSLRAGFDEHLVKPVNLDLLLPLLRTL